MMAAGDDSDGAVVPIDGLPVDGSPVERADRARMAEEIDQSPPSDVLRLLLEEAQVTLRDEIALAGATAQLAYLSVKRMSLFGVIALLFAFVGLLAFVIGLMIAIALVTGHAWLALLVPGSALLVALVAALIARSAGRTLKASVKELQG